VALDKIKFELFTSAIEFAVGESGVRRLGGEENLKFLFDYLISEDYFDEEFTRKAGRLDELRCLIVSNVCYCKGASPVEIEGNTVITCYDGYYLLLT
jgi:hypothetical protein